MIDLNENEYKDLNLIKGNGESLNKDELREKFVSNYCVRKGWNKNSLTEEQLSEIKTHKEYKNPGLLLG